MSFENDMLRRATTGGEPVIDPEELRIIAIDAFRERAGIPGLQRIVQHGRNPQTATYTLHFADGQKVGIGGVDVLWSKTRLSQGLAVAIQRTIAPIGTKDWHELLGGLVAYGIEVEEAPDESWEETVREWAAAYVASSATNDKQGAVAAELPFHDNGEIHLTARGLAKYVRREDGERVALPDIRRGLRELGFERITHNLKAGSTRSYYWAPTDALKGE